MRVPNPASMGPEILSSAGAGVWRKAPIAFPDSSSVLDKFLSVTFLDWGVGLFWILGEGVEVPILF